MKNLLKIVIVLFIFIALNSCGSSSKKNEYNVVLDDAIIPDSVKAIGVWQFPTSDAYLEVYENNTSRKYMPNTKVFIYDGTYVTLRLMTMKDWMWKTPDDYYQTKSKWGHDTLYYLPPFGRKWETVAIFKNENFITHEMINDSLITFTYKKVLPAEVEKDDSVILNKRKPHDYSIKASDPYVE